MNASRHAQGARHQRAVGRAHIGFVAGDAGTRLGVDLHQSGCLRVRTPGGARREGRDGRAEAVLINTAGGLTGGDRLRIAVHCASRARALVTTQACEKLYRSSGDAAHQDVELSAAAGAVLCWVPQPAIAFDGSACRRSLTLRPAAGARLLALEATVLGRAAMGERLRHCRLHERWRVVDDGGACLWASEQRLTDPGRELALPSTLDGGAAFATVVLVDDDAAEQLDVLRELLAAAHGRAGASCVDGRVLIGLLVAPDAGALMGDLQRLIEGLTARPVPRVWTC